MHMAPVSLIILQAVGIIVVLHLFLTACKRAQIQFQRRSRGCEPIPWYPHKDPFLGYDLHRIKEAAMVDNNLHGTILNIIRKHGNGKSIQVLTWGVPTIISYDTRLIKAVLTTHFSYFGVEPVRKAFNDQWIGAGIVMSDGALWKHSRTLLNPLFQQAQLADLDYMEHHVDRLMGLIPMDGTTIDLDTLFQRLYLDISTEWLFGEDIEALASNPRKQVFELLTAVKRALQGVQRRIRLGPQVMRLVPNDKEWLKACEKVQNYFDDHIEKASRQKQATGSSDEAQQKYIDQFTLLRNLIDEIPDRRFLRDQLMSIFLPFHNTSPIGLSDLMFQIARAPRVWSRIRDEVLSLGSEKLTISRLKSLKYLQCVIKEGLRLIAPLDRLIRLTTSDCIIPSCGGNSGEDPVFIPRGTLIDLRTNLLHRDPEVWEDADSFRPERWLEPSLSHGWEYLPFSKGIRVCPSQQMIHSQYSYVVARLAQQYAVLENRDPVTEFVEEYNFNKRSKHGVKVALLRRDIE